MAKKDGYDWKTIIICLAAGMVIMFAISFWVLYDGQPRKINCERATNLCNISAGSGIDYTPYADCDSCCPDDPAPETCDGQLIPTGQQDDYSGAETYCAQFTGCTGSIVQKFCLPVYGIQGKWTSCACQTSFA